MSAILHQGDRQPAQERQRQRDDVERSPMSVTQGQSGDSE
jgi:hypothetical protein